MSDKSHIEWTEATWNPVTGCTLVSEGCRNCYAARLAATRLQHHPSRKGLARVTADGVAKFSGEVRFNEQWLDQPLRWKRGRMIFVCAHGDLFHEAVPEWWINAVFAVMVMAPHHVFQVLTKRPERMRDYLTARLENSYPWEEAADYVADLIDLKEHPVVLEPRDWPLPNVWFGTSCEDQARADERIPPLLDTPAALRFVSAEPLLGPFDLRPYLKPRQRLARLDDVCVAQNGMVSDGEILDWVIVGGESGPGARPMHPDWARSLRDQCAGADVPYFFKQWGAWVPGRYSISRHSMILRPAGGPDCGITLGPPPHDGIHDWGDGYISKNIGKARAGRLLDGREHNGMPEMGGTSTARSAEPATAGRPVGPDPRPDGRGRQK